MAGIPFYTAPLTGDAIIQTADATGQKTVVSVASPGGVAFSLHFTNSTNAAVTVVVSRKHVTNATTRLIREVVVPAGAGIDGAAAIETFDASKLPALSGMAALQDGFKLGGAGYVCEIVVNAKVAVGAGTVTAQFVGGQG